MEKLLKPFSVISKSILTAHSILFHFWAKPRLMSGALVDALQIHEANFQQSFDDTTWKYIWGYCIVYIKVQVSLNSNTPVIVLPNIMFNQSSFVRTLQHWPISRSLYWLNVYGHISRHAIPGNSVAWDLSSIVWSNVWENERRPNLISVVQAYLGSSLQLVYVNKQCVHWPPTTCPMTGITWEQGG